MLIVVGCEALLLWLLLVVGCEVAIVNGCCLLLVVVGCVRLLLIRPPCRLFPLIGFGVVSGPGPIFTGARNALIVKNTKNQGIGLCPPGVGLIIAGGLIIARRD